MDKQEEGELRPTTMPQRATLTDPEAIKFFDDKFKEIVVNPTKKRAFEGFLKGAEKTGEGNLEKGLLKKSQEANKVPEVGTPKGEGKMVSQLPRLRQEAEKLKGEIEIQEAKWKETGDIIGGKRFIKTIESELGALKKMETGILVVNQARIDGFENNLKGVRSEFERAKKAPHGTEVGGHVKLEGKKVEIDQIIPGDPPTWVNVKNYKLFGLESRKFPELKTQAEMNLKAAKANAVNDKRPTIVFDFTTEPGVSPEVATALRAIELDGYKVQVKGTEKPLQVTGTEQPLPQSK